MARGNERGEVLRDDEDGQIRYDHRAGRYEFENPASSQWGAETIYVLADVSDFKGVLGEFIVVNRE